MRVAFVLSLLCLIVVSSGTSAAPRSSYLDDLTSTEVHDALQAGTTTVIIPVGGTEQSGPHMALGKHNARVKVLAGRIAAALGDTLVAPVLAYVPEGAIAPPTGHMRFPGTISIPDNAFKSLLDAAGRSLKQAGFTHIVLIGDHGGYQGLLRDVAAQLNREWAGTPIRAHFIEDYYRVTQTAYVQALRAKGLSDAEIGTHAGVADTSLSLAVDPGLVRTDRLDGARNGATAGVLGDPRASTAALGQIGVELIVTQTVAAIRKARLGPH
jgi:creatinine amidohydrolase/Fe(II)-dependent formamide hydrolase-like protein